MSSLKTVKVLGIILGTFVLLGAVASFIPPRTMAAKESCIALQKQIDGAIQLWEMEHNKGTNAVPAWDDLRPYLKRVPLTCPKGGSLTLGSAAEGPQCSIVWHSLELGYVQVTDTNGIALPDAMVTLFERNQDRDHHLTDTNGTTRVDLYYSQKSEGPLRIVVSKEGFQEASSPVEARWPIRLKLKKE
jgi:hypothetical protein